MMARTISQRRAWATPAVLAGLLLGSGVDLLAEDHAATATDPATQVLAALTAANQARHDAARERSTWQLDEQRLQALVAPATAERSALELQARDLETQLQDTRHQLEALAQAEQLPLVQQRLRQAGEDLRVQLEGLRATTLPGVVPPLDEGGDAASDSGQFEAMVHALDASERAAASVALAIVAGTRDGRTEAVTMLRISGAVGWWVALDGSTSGEVELGAHALRLHAESDPARRDAIQRAVDQATGRAPAAIEILPCMRPITETP